MRTAPATLRDERLRRRLTVGQVARRAGLSKAGVSRIERGEVLRPRAVTLVAILSVLGIASPVPDAVPIPVPVLVPITVDECLAIIARDQQDNPATTSAA